MLVESGRGLPHSTRLRVPPRAGSVRQFLDCASLLALLTTKTAALSVAGRSVFPAS